MGATAHAIVPNVKSIETLHLLTDTVRDGQDKDAMFQALCQQLRPVLIRMAESLRPETPEDLTNVLYLVVRKGARTLPQIETAIKQRYFVQTRSQIRERRKVQALILVHPQNSGNTKKSLGHATPVVVPLGLPPGAVSFVFKALTEEEQNLWVARSEKVPFMEIADELGCTEVAARKRWFTLKAKLEELLSDLEK